METRCHIALSIFWPLRNGTAGHSKRGRAGNGRCVERCAAAFISNEIGPFTQWFAAVTSRRAVQFRCRYCPIGSVRTNSTGGVPVVTVKRMPRGSGRPTAVPLVTPCSARKRA
jgi:hypothetical protein